jgi:DNA-directed RNA polymerase specialized sigma subunit
MEFKSSILSQFINLAHKYTSTQIKHKNKNLNYDDLFQNIVTAISKAIDKYDSGKGALTSYVKYWIINAQNQDNSHTDGLAYEISYTQRQKVAKHETNEVNFSSSLTDSDYHLSDDITPEHIAEESDCT